MKSHSNSNSKRVQLERLNSQMKAEKPQNGIEAVKLFHSYSNGLPDLKENCWYIGQVVEFLGANPIILHGASKVLLRKNGEPDPKRDDLVVYEIKEVGNKGRYAAIGDYKQKYD